MRTSYKGKYQLKNPTKYKGKVDDVVYRSSWELLTFKWLDANPDVIQWSSEELVVPYIDRGDGQWHRYFVDLVITFKSGKRMMIEIKPEAQTRAPKPTRGKRREALREEVMTWAKNTSKWEAAKEYGTKHGMEFHIWTEHTLKMLGIKLNVSRPR